MVSILTVSLTLVLAKTKSTTQPLFRVSFQFDCHSLSTRAAFESVFSSTSEDLYARFFHVILHNLAKKMWLRERLCIEAKKMNYE